MRLLVHDAPQHECGCIVQFRRWGGWGFACNSKFLTCAVSVRQKEAFVQSSSKHQILCAWRQDTDKRPAPKSECSKVPKAKAQSKGKAKAKAQSKGKAKAKSKDGGMKRPAARQEVEGW